MVGPRRGSALNPCSFTFSGPLPPPAPYYAPPNTAISTICLPPPPPISHLSPYYDPPSGESPPSSRRLTPSLSPPSLRHSDSFPPPSSPPSPDSPFHRLSLPSSSTSPTPPVSALEHQGNCGGPDEDCSPLWVTTSTTRYNKLKDWVYQTNNNMESFSNWNLGSKISRVKYTCYLHTLCERVLVSTKNLRLKIPSRPPTGVCEGLQPQVRGPSCVSCLGI